MTWITTRHVADNSRHFRTNPKNVRIFGCLKLVSCHEARIKYAKVTESLKCFHNLAHNILLLLLLLLLWFEGGGAFWHLPGTVLPNSQQNLSLQGLESSITHPPPHPRKIMNDAPIRSIGPYGNVLGMSLLRHTRAMWIYGQWYNDSTQHRARVFGMGQVNLRAVLGQPVGAGQCIR